MSSPASTSMTAYRPVLYLGLGGTGKEVLLRLRLRMFERFRTFDVPFARFLWIDTDTRATDARGADLSSALAAMSFAEGEKFALLNGSVGKDLHNIFENPGQWPHIHEWLYPEVQRLGSEIADGAGGVRAVGRLTFFAKYARLRETVERKLNELSRLETIGQTQSFFREHKLPTVNTDGSSAPVICVITSLAGGTGCGTFLDMGFLLRDIKRLNANVADIFSYAVLPNVYNASPEGEIPKRSFANAYAAMKELDHFTKRISSRDSQDARENNPYSDFIVSWEAQRERRIEGPPFSATYLIESTNQANLSISPENRGDLFSMLAETLFLDLLPGPFSDAKRSNYSNIVQALSGPAGANTGRGTGNVSFAQAFARRYASCGMSKIEIPLDTVRGVCAAKLAISICDYMTREREDADVGRAVPRDLAAARLDKDGIVSSYGSKWRDIITETVATAINSHAIQTGEDARTLRTALLKAEEETVLADSDRVGTSLRWLKQRTPTVNAEIKQRLADLLRERVLENQERGLVTGLRKGGYLELAIDATRALLNPTQAGSKSVYDQAIGEAEDDALALRDLRERELNELELALRSLPVRLLGAREQVVKIMLGRVRDTTEQYLYTLAERYLLYEARNATLELLHQMRLLQDALAKFLERAETLRGTAQARLRTYTSRLDHGSHVLFLQIFDTPHDLPQFYKLGIDPVTQQPAEVDPKREYEGLLREFGMQHGLAELAELLASRTTDEVNRRVEEFCDRRFYEDFIAYPRPVSILDHPLLRDATRSHQTIQNFVNHAQPMLRRDEKLAASEIESTTFAYLGIADKSTPAAQEFIAEVRSLLPTKCQFDFVSTGRTSEIYLYFSTFAFPLPSVALVQNECHLAYTDFYAQFHPGEASKPGTGVPLHLSQRWEGRFDDLVIYSDRQAELLEEVLTILNLAPPLHVLTVRTNADSGMLEYFYREAPPFNATRSLNMRRNLISHLMADATLRQTLTGEIERREAALSPDQLVSFFWALQAQYHHPDLDRDSAEAQLLRRELQQVYQRTQMMVHAAPGAPATAVLSASDVEQLPPSGQLAWIEDRVAGLKWENGTQPIVEGLDLWRRV